MGLFLSVVKLLTRCVQINWSLKNCREDFPPCLKYFVFNAMGSVEVLAGADSRFGTHNRPLLYD
jgi:hypothetical protein